MVGRLAERRNVPTQMQKGIFLQGIPYRHHGSYEGTLPDGSGVQVTRTPVRPSKSPLGWHRRIDGDRLDLIAYQFLKDATRSWELCDTNNTVAPDALATRDLIGIPEAGRPTRATYHGLFHPRPP